MNITLKNTQEQADMHRKIYTVTCAYDSTATPSRVTFKQEIAKKVKVKPETLIVRQIVSKYGGGGATITAVAYNNEKSIQQFEPTHMIKKNTPPKQEEKKE